MILALRRATGASSYGRQGSGGAVPVTLPRDVAEQSAPAASAGVYQSLKGESR